MIFRHTRRRRLSALAILLSAALLVAGILPVSAASRISPKETFTPGEATLTELRAFFQNGAYWNHISGTEDTPYSVTDTPCSPYTDSDGLHRDEGVVCNYFGIPGVVWGGWQCCGFLRLMTYLYFGVSFENWDTSASLPGLKAGDVLYLTSGGPHYIWVLSVTDNADGTKRITYTDCNGAGRRVHCQIQWDARCTVNMQTQELELAAIGTWDVFKRYVAPGDARTVLPESNKTPSTSTTPTTPTTTDAERAYLLAYSDGQGHTASARSATGDLTLPACPFKRPGFTFAGWTLQRASDEARLCGAEWKSGVPADAATRWEPGATLPSSLFAGIIGELYDVIAVWTENRLTVRYHPNGGQFTDAAFAADAQTGVVIRTDTGLPAEDTWEYAALTGREKLPDAEEWGLMCPGYTFVGWGVAPRNKNTMTAAALADRLAGVSGEETWYAVWVPNRVEVWYKAEDGTVESDEYQRLDNGRICRRDHPEWALTRIFYNATAASLLTAEELGLSRDGFALAGWTRDGETLVSESAIKRMGTAQSRLRIELTAVWQAEAAPPPKNRPSDKKGAGA